MSDPVFGVFTDHGQLVSDLFRHAYDAEVWIVQNQPRFYWRKLRTKVLPVQDDTEVAHADS